LIFNANLSLFYSKGFVMRLILVSLVLFSCHTVWAEESFEPVNDLLITDTSNTPVDAIESRLNAESINEELKFSLIPHKPTYLLPFNYNQKIKDYTLYESRDDLKDLQQTEIKYQISFKIPLFHHLGDLPLSGYFAYTQSSFWQAYNTEASSPFRETNYEPELFLRWTPDKNIAHGWYLKAVSGGFAHQSNGRSEPISRSWNRLNANVIVGKENVAIVFNPWYRFEESALEDDNADLLDYYGHGEVAFIYKNADRVFSLISRNNIESGFSKGSIRASLSFPLFENVRGYVQAFSGYGNSLIEYNVYTNTIGIGFSINDFL